MTLTREEALHEINVSHVTSLGKIQGDYLIFSKTATSVIEMLCNSFEQHIADYKKRINELEAHDNCGMCKHYDGSHKCNNENSIAWEASNRVYPDDYCKDYEPKDKQ